MDMFLIDDMHSVMILDATLASHPIVQTAESPDQITELFDSITYNKGAAVIRMLEDFVGGEVFRNSVTAYLTRHSYKNAVTEDLLTEVEALADGLDVKYIMSTWTKQMGYPVVTVTPTGNNGYRLTQQRFFSNPENAQEVHNDSEFK